MLVDGQCVRRRLLGRRDFPSNLQKDLGLPTGYVALPIMLQSLMFFLSAMLWGWCADRFGRRTTLMITSLVTIPIAPLYLLATD